MNGAGTGAAAGAGAGLGYRIGKIEELATSIVKSYNTLGEKMADGWTNLSTTMEAEWVGPDELSYETQLATDICTLYANCLEAVNSLTLNVKTVADDWRNFQRNNVLEGLVIENVVGDAFKELEIPEMTSYDIASVVKAGTPTFGADTLMGLTNGLSSAANIKKEFDSYVNNVYTNVKSLYDSFAELIGVAFEGGNTKTSLEGYLTQVYESIAKLSTCHKSIYEALDQLINKYQEMDEALSSKIDTATETEAGADFSASLGGAQATTSNPSQTN